MPLMLRLPLFLYTKKMGVWVMVMDENNERDELLIPALNCMIEHGGNVSIGMLQRRFKIGFNRAAKIVDQLEADGLVSHRENGKQHVLVSIPEKKDVTKEEQPIPATKSLPKEQPVKKKSAGQIRRERLAMGCCPMCGSNKFHYVLRSSGSSTNTKYYRHHKGTSYVWSSGRSESNRKNNYGTIGYCPDCGYKKGNTGQDAIVSLIELIILIAIFYFMIHR